MTKKVLRKSFVFGIILIFFIMVLFPTFEADFIEKKVTLERNMNNNTFTHTILGEESTATWCGYCPEASAQLYQVYNMGYDFEFVTLVADMNSYADGRCNELGITGYPTVDFDGGYTTIIGQQPSYTQYENAVINCGARTVADISIDLHAYWMGDGQILVNVGIINNEASTYNGHLHVYVTEITSRWNDASGTPYHFAMINDYAFNQAVTVSGSSIQTYSAPWVGYDDISMDNIRVIACVFGQSSMFTDETIAVDPQEGEDGDGGDLNLPKVLITYPTENLTINGTITITGNAYDLNGTIKSVYLKIGDDGGWIKSQGTEQWELTWDTTKYTDGIYQIYAIALNNHGLQSAIAHKTVNVLNNETEPDPEPEKNPDLKCEGQLSWIDIKPESTVTGNFKVKNIGDADSVLNWTIIDYPSWGTWNFTPSNGENLTPEDGIIIVDIIVIAPETQKNNFSGQIRIENKENKSDYEIIDIALSTYKNKETNILLSYIEKLIYRFPFFEKILKQYCFN